MASITIQAENPAELLAFVRSWLAEQDPGSGNVGPAGTGSAGDADKIAAAIDRIYGRQSVRFVRQVAEAGQRGDTVTVDDVLASAYEVADGGSLGGAIGTAASVLFRTTGREILQRISRYPSVWRMNAADADVVLGLLDQRVDRSR